MRSISFAYIQQMVKDQAGIVVEPGKEYLAESKLAPLAREQGFDAIEPFVSRLRTQPHGELHRRVVEALTTNETSFFRDDRAFDALRTVLIPKLLAKQPDRKLAIWCAAAASGQEPYSIAMMLREHFPSAAARARIIASDISREMLARTGAGVYSQFEVGRGLSPAAVARHMVPHGTEWKVRPELRAMIDLREINLASPFPSLPAIDILLVRNVLIYFEPARKQDILARMRWTLGSDGVLILGGAETTLGVDVELERCTADNKATWYRRKGAR
jgi:chemotaxis protein methyltransferase CheR